MITQTTPRCPHCGYTEEDAKVHGDHHLCKGRADAPWNKKPWQGSASEFMEKQFADPEIRAVYERLGKR